MSRSKPGGITVTIGRQALANLTAIATATGHSKSAVAKMVMEDLTMERLLELQRRRAERMRDEGA